MMRKLEIADKNSRDFQTVDLYENDSEENDPNDVLMIRHTSEEE